MEYQVAILSQDAVFARMLELEFLMQELRVFSGRELPEGAYAEVVLLDLDNTSAPDSACYGRMFGFTAEPSLRPEAEQRACAMILHRPFEVGVLRREVLSHLFPDLKKERHAVTVKEDGFARPVLDQMKKTLAIGSRQISLTPLECRIIGLLLSKRGTPVSKEEIGRVIGESSANKVEVYICYLRKKTDDENGMHLIRTVRGKGYVIK